MQHSGILRLLMPSRRVRLATSSLALALALRRRRVPP